MWSLEIRTQNNFNNLTKYNEKMGSDSVLNILITVSSVQLRNSCVERSYSGVQRPEFSVQRPASNFQRVESTVRYLRPESRYSSMPEKNDSPSHY